MPYVQTLLLTNKFNNLLALHDAGPVADETPPAGSIDYGGTHSSPEQMSRAILARLGSKNVLVGFHVG